MLDSDRVWREGENPSSDVFNLIVDCVFYPTDKKIPKHDFSQRKKNKGNTW